MMYTHNELLKMAEAAFQEVTLAVIKTARQTDTPIIVWKDGRVTEIHSDQFEELEASQLRGEPSKTENALRAITES